MKKFAIGCGTTIAALAVVIVIVFYATSGVVGAADEFVDHLAKGEIDQAYALLGPAVTGEMPRDNFEDWLKGTKLDQAESAFWTSRNINNDRGEVAGDLTLKGGDTKPLVIILEKMDGTWKIQGIQFKKLDLSSDSGSPESAAVTAKAKEFLTYITEAQLPAAYALVGEGLRGDLDEQQFNRFVRESGLASSQSAEWKEPELSDGQARIEAKLTLDNEKHLELSLMLEQKENDWVVQGIRFKPLEGLSELPAPTEAEGLALISELQKALGAYVDNQDDSLVKALCHATLRYQLEDQQKGLSALVASFPDKSRFRQALDLTPQLVETPVKDEKYGAKIRSKSQKMSDGAFLTVDANLGVENDKWVFTSFEIQIRK